jgi:hypothetical protein
MAMEMNRAASNGSMQRHLARRYHAQSLVFAVVISPLAMIDRAEAACDATSPVNNTTITCTGTTSNGFTGFGISTDTGNTYNVQTGATVSGTADGLRFLSGTVNNSGLVTATDGSAGILSDNNMTVSNSGTISATADGGTGIFSNGTATVTNSGTITGGGTGEGVGIDGVGAVKVVNSGTISVGAGDSFGIVSETSTATVDNSGTITSGGRRYSRHSRRHRHELRHHHSCFRCHCIGW